MGNGSLHQGHRERMRQRFIDTGGKGMYEHELLEMLLFYSIPRQNTNDLAHTLIKHFGSLRAVLEAPEEELVKVKGLGAASARFITRIRKISEQFRSLSGERIMLDTTKSITEFVSEKFNDASSELCMVTILDLSLSVKNTFIFPYNDILSNEFTVREITRLILLNSSRRIIISVCRPDSLPVPSQKDYTIIRNIADMVTPLGISVIDSTITGRGRTFSLREHGAFGFTK